MVQEHTVCGEVHGIAPLASSAAGLQSAWTEGCGAHVRIADFFFFFLTCLFPVLAVQVVPQ